MRFHRSFLLIFSTVLLTAAVVSVGSAQRKAPPLILKTNEGKVVNLAQLKGKVVVVNFWATWCGPCRAEIPDFLKVYDEYRPKGVEIVGVSLDEGGWSDVTPFIQRYKITYPVVVGDAAVARAWGNIEAIPTTFIIDKQGNVIDRHIGMMSRDALTTKLKSLL